MLIFIKHQSQRFSESKTERNWNYCEASSPTNDYHGQQDTFYYQPNNYNQRQQYRHDRTKQQYPYRTDYDREKWDKRGIVHIGIPPPTIKQLPIIPFLMNLILERKNLLFLLILP